MNQIVNNVQSLPQELQMVILNYVLKICIPNEISETLSLLQNNVDFHFKTKKDSIKLMFKLQRVVQLMMFDHEMVKTTVKTLIPDIRDKDLIEYTISDIMRCLEINVLCDDETILSMLYSLRHGFTYIFVTYTSDNEDFTIRLNYTPFENNLRWILELITIENGQLKEHLLDKTMYKYEFYKEHKYTYDMRNNTLNLMMNMYDLLYNIVPNEINLGENFNIKMVDIDCEPIYEHLNEFDFPIECLCKEEYNKFKKDNEGWMNVKNIYNNLDILDIIHLIH